jgi:hypothetical protein
VAKNQTVRVPKAQLEQDRRAYVAVKANERYAPANAEFSKAELDSAFDELDAAEHEVIQVEGRLAAARDRLVAAQWRCHNKMLGVKAQIVAQFGPNSNEAADVGLKKPDEYKSPTPKKKKDGGGTK